MKTYLIFILFLMLFSSTIVSAQETKKTSFGILGGVNFQNMNGKDFTGENLENDLIVGYHIGVNVQIPIVPDFYFQPGLLISTKGAKNNNNALSTTTKISYVELPLNFVYKALVGKGYFMFGLGPYIGYGISGKVNFENEAMSEQVDVEFTSVVEINDPLTVQYYKALDLGGNIFFGYELANGIFALLNAQLGMLKINPERKILTNDKSVVKNTGFGLSVGYRF